MTSLYQVTTLLEEPANVTINGLLPGQEEKSPGMSIGKGGREGFFAVTFKLSGDRYANYDTPNACRGQQMKLGERCDLPFHFLGGKAGDYRGELNLTIVITENGETRTEYQTLTIMVRVRTPETIPNCPSIKQGSELNVDGQTVAETIPLVGVPFDLHYTTRFAQSRFNIENMYISVENYGDGGWRPSVLGFFDGRSLFEGDGRISAATAVQEGNLVRVANIDGSEFYIFDASTYQHKETISGLTGALKYSFFYDVNGKLSRISDAFGNTTAFERNAVGQLVAIRGPYGQTTVVAYGSDGLLSSVMNPKGDKYEMTYKPGTDLLYTFKKPAGHKTTFTYKADGALLRDKGMGGNFWDIVKDPQQSYGPITLSSALGRKTSYQTSRNSSGRYIRTTTEPTGLVTTYEEGLNNSSQVVSNTLIRSTSTKTLDQRVPGAFRESQSTLRAGGITSTTNYAQQVIYPSGVTPGLFNYTALKHTSTTSGRKSISEFNRLTMLETSISPAGAKRMVKYDSFERPIEIRTGNDLPVRLAYDDRGRLSEASIDNVREKTTFAYDDAGNLSSISDVNGQTTYTYDPGGRLISTRTPAGNLIQYRYDRSGNIVGVAPPTRPVHSFKINAFELPASYTPPVLADVANPATIYHYNLDKQLTKIERPDGQAITFNYGATTGLLDSVNMPSGAITYVRYPTTGLPRLIATPDIRTWQSTWGYLPYGNEQYDLSDGKLLFNLYRTFDTDHRVTARILRGPTYNVLSTIPITYNDDDQIQKIGDLSLTYTYPSGRLSKLTVGNVNETRSYFNYGRLSIKSYAYSPGNGLPDQPLYMERFTWDDAGRVYTRNETVKGVMTSYKYKYDKQGRLAYVYKNNTLISRHIYDRNGNRTSGTINGVPFTATYDAQDRLLSFNGNTYSYNATGELIKVQNSLTGKTYSYDALGTLKSSVTENGTNVSYGTDGENRRVFRKVNGNLRSRYIYEDGLRIAAEYLNGNLVAEFIYATDINVPDYMIKSGVKYRFVKDRLGSPRMIVNTANGTIAQQIEYNELGKILSDTNPGFQPFGFAGGIYDGDTKLVHFGAREYDPETGRWTSKDPILFAGGDTNLYGYTFNDPINFIDSDGLSAEDVRRIQNTFNKSVARMTAAGQRQSPGWLNNMSRSLNDLTGGRAGSPFLGCGEQADVVQKDLQNGSYDDVWDFAWDGLFDPLPHQRIRATSSNPNDPVLTIDPHRNLFQTGR